MKTKKKLLLAGIGLLSLVGLIVATVLFGQPIIEVFKDPERTRAFVTQAGPWAPLVFMAMQLLQVFIAPIPGQVTGFMGGYLFGTLWGTIYTTIGGALGFSLVFMLARKLGRPFVEHFVDKKTLKRFDYLAQEHGVMIFFLIFLLPFFPDDLICYIAGLTTIKVRTLIIISLIARFPSTLALSLAGAGAAESNMSLVVGIIGGMGLISMVAYWQRRRIEAFIAHFRHRSSS